VGELLLYFQVNIIIVEEVSRSETQSETKTSFYINCFGKGNPQGLCLSQGQLTSTLHSILLVNAVFNQMKTKILRRTSEVRRKSLTQTILGYTNFRSGNSSTRKGKYVRAGPKHQANVLYTVFYTTNCSKRTAKFTLIRKKENCSHTRQRHQMKTERTYLGFLAFSP